MKYNLETLLEFTAKYNMVLLTEETKEPISPEEGYSKPHGKMVIHAKCCFENCENVVSKTFYSMIMYNPYCKNCSQNERKKKVVKTNLEKIGVENPFQNKEIKEKIKKSNLEKYGVENAFQNKEIQEKAKTTNLEKYGHENPFQNKEIQAKIKEINLAKYGVIYSQQNAEIREKGKQTNLEKYGHENPFGSKEIQEKIKETNLEKYGCEKPLQCKEFKDKVKKTNVERYGHENPFGSKEIQEKIKETNLEKYGVEYSLQSNDVREKGKQTCLLRYGVEHASQSKQIHDKIKKTTLDNYGVEYPNQSEILRSRSVQTCLENPMQDKDISEKSQNNMMRTKEYIFPSGKKIQIQGYEAFAIDELQREHGILEEDIITERGRVPEIWYLDEEGKKHRHFVDIYIVSQKKCIEVKSSWTFQMNPDKIFAKQNAAKENGLNYEIWIYDHKQNRIKCIL